MHRIIVMMDRTTRDTLPYAIETVWDGGASATVIAGHDALTVGETGGWAPEQLLLVGAETSFMNSFLTAAAEGALRVLGYVSSCHLEPADEPNVKPRVTLRPCVVVGVPEDVRRAGVISTIAQQRSVAGQLLGDRLRVRLDVRLETPD